MTSVFGDILTGHDVEQAVETTVAYWLPTYLREVERQKGIDHGALPGIASTVTVNEFAQFQGQTLPCAVVICPGTEGEPEWHDGKASYWWTVGIAVIVEAVNETAARELAQLYAAAIRTLLAQKPSLGGFASKLKLGVESGDNAPADFIRAGCAVTRVVFSVLVEGVVTALAGPTVPADDPQAWPEVETVHIDAERLTVS